MQETAEAMMEVGCDVVGVPDFHQKSGWQEDLIPERGLCRPPVGFSLWRPCYSEYAQASVCHIGVPIGWNQVCALAEDLSGSLSLEKFYPTETWPQKFPWEGSPKVVGNDIMTFFVGRCISSPGIFRIKCREDEVSWTCTLNIFVTREFVPFFKNGSCLREFSILESLTD